MSRFDPADLYERLLAIRRREGCDADAAVRRLAAELAEHAADVWRRSGEDYLRRLEQAFHHSRPFLLTEEWRHNIAARESQVGRAPTPAEMSDPTHEPGHGLPAREGQLPRAGASWMDRVPRAALRAFLDRELAPAATLPRKRFGDWTGHDRRTFIQQTSRRAATLLDRAHEVDLIHQHGRHDEETVETIVSRLAPADLPPTMKRLAGIT